MLNDQRSHGLWEMTAPPAPATLPLQSETTADVVIVGGGYTGLSAALHLAETGSRVVLLEAVEFGFGGAGRNCGLVNAGLWVLPDAIGETLGTERGEALLSLLGDAPAEVFALIAKHGMACEAETHGTLHCGVGSAGHNELQQRAAQWWRRGVPVELLETAQAEAATGTAAYSAALRDPRAGTVQPLAYARGLASAAMSAGATLYSGSPVIACEREGTGWRVTTAQGSVVADWVLVATDAYSSGPFSAVAREQVAFPYFNIATVPLPQEARKKILPGREGAWDTKAVLSSFRLDRAGRLVFGSVGALRGTGLAVHRAWTRRQLRKLFPAIGEVPFEAEWFGTIGMTGDHMPRFHKLGPNMLALCGYNGRGIAPGTVFGRCLADIVLGRMREEDCPVPLSQPQDAPLRGLRSLAIEWGAQAAHLI